VLLHATWTAEGREREDLDRRRWERARGMRPCLRYDLVLSRAGAEGSVEVGSSRLGGIGWLELDEQAEALLHLLLPLLNGERTLEQVVAECDDQGYGKADVETVVRTLQSAGVLVDLETTDGRAFDPSLLPFHRLLAAESADTQAIVERVMSTTYTVVDLVGVGEPAVLALARAGAPRVRFVNAPRSPGTTASHAPLIVAAEALGCLVSHHSLSEGTDVLPRDLDGAPALVLMFARAFTGRVMEWHDRFFEHGVPLLPVLCRSAEWRFGPLVERGPCLRCRQLRSEPGGDAHVVQESVAGVTPFLDSLSSVASGYAVCAVAMPDGHPLSGRTVSFDGGTMTSQVTYVLRDPDCPLCGRRNRVPERRTVNCDPVDDGED